MHATDTQDYLSLRRAEARRIVCDPALCLAKPHLRALAWRVLNDRPRRAPSTLRLTPQMRVDAGPDDAA